MQGLIQPGLKHLQSWGIHILSEKWRSPGAGSSEKAGCTFPFSSHSDVAFTAPLRPTWCSLTLGSQEQHQAPVERFRKPPALLLGSGATGRAPQV